MNHNAIVANLTQVDDDIAFLQSSPSTQEIAFNLGETNIDFTNLNMDQFEGVLGSALWTVDYILYGASQNINRMYLHQGTTFGYAAWQPIATNTSQPKVRSPWYGLKFAAEAIGSHQGPIQIVPLDFVVQSLPSNSTNSSSSSGVDTNANITTPTATAINANTTNPTATGTNPSGTTSSADPHQLLTSEKISAYGIYESSSLARIALINLNEWNATTPYPRPTALFKLALPRAGSASANGDVSARSAKKCTLRRANTGNGSEDANENEGDNGNDQGQGSGKVTIRKLTAPGGASADSDLTFGGIMWNYTTQGLPQRVQGVPGTVEVDRLLQDGSVLIELGASEALLIDVA
ncbi:glycoside hydrolase family 79 protein [Collybiopsis luxurians FD-317 M1]|uniref:Glycoside hydrolase family 79 protein n=1 Tax=Collybiopsis luxurians FD-317 M1 TaxID=944289 RepID=A0A0D0CJQ6_9AGAR|nr:glycoside hydrolase family 79 protein [Collybiopsis luxurians FD-317 M1]